MRQCEHQVPTISGIDAAPRVKMRLSRQSFQKRNTVTVFSLPIM